MDSADPAIAVLEPDGVIRTIGPAIRSITGRAPEDYVGHNVAEQIHPDDMERVAQRWEWLVGQPDGARTRIRLRARTEPGGWRWIEVMGTKATAVPGLEAVVTSVRDIHDEQSLLDDVREAELQAASGAPDSRDGFLRILLSMSADAVLVFDDDFNIVWSSPGLARATGWSSERLRATSPVDMVHRDDLSKMLTGLSALRGEAASGSTAGGSSVTVRLSGGDGTWRWTDVVGRDLRDDPTIGGIALAFTDADDRVRASERIEASERRHRALVQHSNDGVLVCDAAGVVTYASEAVTSLMGWPGDQIVGLPIGTSLAEPHRSTVLDAFELVKRNPGQVTTVQFVCPRLDGTDVWLETVLSSQLDDPDVGGVVWNFRDITEQRQMLDELESAAETFRSLAVSSTTGLFEETSEHGCVEVNPRWVAITGIEAPDALGQGWHAMIPPGDKPALIDLAVAEPGPEPPRRLRIRRADGEIRWVDVRSTVLAANADGVRRRIGGLEDVTDAVLAEEDRRGLLEIFDLTNDLVTVVGADGRLIFLNTAGRAFHGFTEAEYDRTVGTEWPLQLPRGDDVHDLLDAIKVADRWSGEVVAHNAAGQELTLRLELLVHRDDKGEIDHYSSLAHDVTERKALEAVLEYQATHDELTGLPNRTLLLREIQHTLDQLADTGSGTVAVLFIDLDHFKVINDSLGHDLGDQLLRESAIRLRGAIRPADLVARFGGDEFVVVCSRLQDTDEATAIAGRIDAHLSVPFEISGHEIHSGVSIGISHARPGELDPGAVLRDADTAMYHAKAGGRRRWVTFDDELRRLAVERQQMENALRSTAQGQEMELVYQPVVRLDDYSLVGVEALLRWHHRGEVILPDEFIPLAEDTGIIQSIGTWVMAEAFGQAARWQGTADVPTGIGGASGVAIAINVSVRQLLAPGFLGTIEGIAARSGISPSLITIEITESVLLQATGSTRQLLGELSAMGFRLALDDFGTGYSPLIYLNDLPIDVVKLDRSFVAGVGTRAGSTAIVTALVELTAAMGLEVVAEGVETEHERKVLAELGCELGQGYLLAPPVGAEAIPEVLSGLAERRPTRFTDRRRG